MTSDPLPIHAVLPALLDALRGGSAAVLVAPPGAGKTTAVAPALLAEPWCTGQVILLSPRRVAARAAAERMADALGEKPGERIGYATRLDTRQSAATRVLVVTEAIFVSRILADPELTGVSAVLFDEAHERHLDSDLGLALAIEAQTIVRPDLRLVVMSATIDGARFAGLLGDAPVIKSEGRAHPLRIEWLGARAELRTDEAMANAVLAAWRAEEGDLLAFLPGVGEIERTLERLTARLPDVPILPLHGQVEPAAQRAAIRRDPQGRRRIVLATAIAETSLTFEGVSVVVDSGLSRRAEFDLAAGVTHLVTRRASQAAAAQRAGRAARQGPGVAYRLWEQAAHAGREAFDPPEMLTSDLAPLVLATAQWGADPSALPWLDPPPAAAVMTAGKRLEQLSALDSEGRITERGRRIAELPMAPWHAAMMLFGAEHGVADMAGKVALLLQERGLGGRSEDLAERLLRWDSDRSTRAVSARKLAAGWARRAEGLVAPTEGEAPSAGTLLALALPDNLARRRDASGENWLSAGGRGYTLDPASSLAREEWIVIGDAQGQAKGARITAALALPFPEITRWLQDRMADKRHVRWVAESETAEPVRERRMGAILVSRGFDVSADQGEITRVLLDHFEKTGIAALPLSDTSRALLERARYAGIDALAEAALMASAEDWLGSLIADAQVRSLRDLPPNGLHATLLNQMDFAARQRLEKVAPAQFASPAGTHHPIDYADPAGPSVEVRVQALFGLDRHPLVGATPLLLKLTSPAGRPLQATRDLPGFWRGSWADVKREMKGRYPRHRWPDEPWSEAPSLKTKNAFLKS